MKCLAADGTKKDITWKYTHNAYLAAITICNMRLDASLRTGSSLPLVAIIGVNPPWAGEDESEDQMSLRSDWLVEVQEKITTTGFFRRVDIFDALQLTPTLGELLKYDSILVYSDGDFLDGATLGDVVANYSDTGKGVVVAVFETFGDALFGRWADENYDPISSGESADVELTLGETLVLHPVLAGVNSFDGGTSSYHSDGSPTDNTILIATWSNDAPLVVEKTGKQGRIIATNFYPPSNDSRTDFWHADTDGTLLLGNALKYVARG